MPARFYSLILCILNEMIFYNYYQTTHNLSMNLLYHHYYFDITTLTLQKTLSTCKREMKWEVEKSSHVMSYKVNSHMPIISIPLCTHLRISLFYSLSPSSNFTLYQLFFFSPFPSVHLDISNTGIMPCHTHKNIKTKPFTHFFTFFLSLCV